LAFFWPWEENRQRPFATLSALNITVQAGAALWFTHITCDYVCHTGPTGWCRSFMRAYRGATLSAIELLSLTITSVRLVSGLRLLG